MKAVYVAVSINFSQSEREWQEEDGSIGLEVRMPMVDWRRLCKQEQQLPDYVI